MRLVTLLRWTARLAATAMTALLITFLLGEGTPDVRELSDRELLGFGAVLLMVLGTLLAWFRELRGGLLQLVGYGAFAAVENGWPPAPFLVYLGAGVGLVLTGLVRRFRPPLQPVAKGSPEPRVPAGAGT